jgi:hypothetical protein
MAEGKGRRERQEGKATLSSTSTWRRWHDGMDGDTLVLLCGSPTHPPTTTVSLSARREDSSSLLPLPPPLSSAVSVYVSAHTRTVTSEGECSFHRWRAW